MKTIVVCSGGLDSVTLAYKVAAAVPFAETWSCYKGGSLHCRRCGTCVERREALHLAGIEDPTPYDYRVEACREHQARRHS